MRLTHKAHHLLAGHLKSGDLVLDATAGNGHDSLFLARAVAPEGWLFAFDIQTQALANTRRRLAQAGLLERARLIQAGHQALIHHLPPWSHGRLAAAMFNLGYLPGGDHRLSTRPDTTSMALEQALALLAPGGRLSVLCYRHHPGGEEEYQRVERWLRSRSELELEEYASPGPVLFMARKP